LTSAQRSARPVSWGILQPAAREQRPASIRAPPPCRKHRMPPILLGSGADFKPDPAPCEFVGHQRSRFGEMHWRAGELKNRSRQVRKLRRKVYRQMPVATRNRVAELDHRTAYADIATTLERGELGVLSGGAAMALWRACRGPELP